MSRRLQTTPTGLHKQHSVLCPAVRLVLVSLGSNVPVSVRSSTQVPTAADRTAKDVLEDKGLQRSTRQIHALVGDKVDKKKEPLSRCNTGRSRLGYLAVPEHSG